MAQYFNPRSRSLHIHFGGRCSAFGRHEQAGSAQIVIDSGRAQYAGGGRFIGRQTWRHYGNVTHGEDLVSEEVRGYHF